MLRVFICAFTVVMLFSLVACGAGSGNSGIEVCGKPVVEETVKNGSGTSSIGTRGLIEVNPDELTDETLTEICEAVKDLDYNYFTVDCGDGTGIVFPGCEPIAGSYGSIGDEGELISTEKLVSPTSSGYTLEALED